jgi:hypothetical protein
MAWTFSGTFLDGAGAERVTAGTGEPEELRGRFALARPAAVVVRGTRVR